MKYSQSKVSNKAKFEAFKKLRGLAHNIYGSFPQPVHFFAAAQENEDIGALWKGPSMP